LKALRTAAEKAYTISLKTARYILEHRYLSMEIHY